MATVKTEIYQDEDRVLVFQSNETDRYIARGMKLYASGMEKIAKHLSKTELLTFLSFSTEQKNLRYISRANIMTKPFRYYTEQLSDAQRSKFKKKLFEIGAIGEYNGFIMINPFILVPRVDKNIKNFQYLVQRTWVYLFEDSENYCEDLEQFIELIFLEQI